MKRAITAGLLALVLAFSLFALPVQAEVRTEYPELTPGPFSLTQEEIDLLAQRLTTAQRTTGNTFEISNCTAAGGPMLSTDYTAGSLNAWNGVVTVTEADRAMAEEFLAGLGLADATDAEKIAGAQAWIHTSLVYDGPHSGSYVHSGFVDAGGQCNIYNGAICALLNILGYKAQLVRGYRASTAGQSAHWWVELLTDGEPLVFESGNVEDGSWHYLGATYAETHGGDRDYIKCGAYAWNGEPYVKKGAAPYRFGAALSSDGTDALLTGRVAKDSDCTVTEVGLLVSENGGPLREVAREPVDEAANRANEGEGFSMAYKLSECGVTLTPGESLAYAFFAVVDGEMLQTETAALALPAAETVPEEQPESALLPEEGAWQLALGGLGVLALLLVAGLLGRRMLRPNRRRGRANLPQL